MLAHLLEQGGWDVVAVSRRKPRIGGVYRHIAVDLLDPADCQAKLATRTAYSLPITISSPIRARPAVSDSTIWWTPRRCFFSCFQTFGVSGLFRDLPSVLVACARATSSPARRRFPPLRRAGSWQPSFREGEVGASQFPVAARFARQAHNLKVSNGAGPTNHWTISAG
jgi:hypothetical protein